MEALMAYRPQDEAMGAAIENGAVLSYFDDEIGVIPAKPDAKVYQISTQAQALMFL